MEELDHSFSTGRPTDDHREAVLALDRLIPCVGGGSALERTGPDSIEAEIKVTLGAMSMIFRGTVEVTDSDLAAHRAAHRLKSRDSAERATPSRAPYHRRLPEKHSKSRRAHYDE